MLLDNVCSRNTVELFKPNNTFCGRLEIGQWMGSIVSCKFLNIIII